MKETSAVVEKTDEGTELAIPAIAAQVGRDDVGTLEKIPNTGGGKFFETLIANSLSAGL